MPLRRPLVITGALALMGAAACGCLYFILHRRENGQTADDSVEDSRQRRYQKLSELKNKLDRLLISLESIEAEEPDNEDDECIVCNSAKAVIQTFPCGHKVLCRMCFVKTLQVAVLDFNLPLKCVMCRTKISTLDRERHEQGEDSEQSLS